MVSEHSLIVPFVNGTAWNDSGWLVDAAGEYAGTFFTLPSWVQRVLWIRVYARSVVAETHSMALTVSANGGADNEAYTTEAISVADKSSVSVNFAADDVIYWEIDSGDDADIGHLIGGDSVEFKITGQVAAGDDCATNAYFRCIHVGVQ